jgi:DMSO/TMAO reductase YedYZ molybdopterin-dependent catalytic subunit
MRTSKSIWLGALTGFFLTIALVAIFDAGYEAANLPFLPFNLFDWQTRVLPGPVLARGINGMVSTIRWLRIGNTSATAKLAEQSLAVIEFLVGGIVIGGIFFVLATSFRWRRTIIPGLLTGGFVAVAALSISHTVEGGVHSFGSGLWVAIACLAWGLALGWAFRQAVHETTPDLAAVPATQREGRRFILALGGAAAVIAVTGAVFGRVIGNRERAVGRTEQPWSALNPLPNANAPVQPVPGTRPEFTPLAQHYRIDINTIPPQIDEASWRLRISGLIEEPLEWTLDEIRSRPPMNQFITLSCISNLIGGDLIGTQRWTGASLKPLLPELRLRSNATHLKIRSADGFYEVVALEAIRADDRLMLTYAWDGLPLAAKHGFPLRIYIPDRYGMKQPKWIESIEAMDHWEPGYWVTRGWDREAIMKATSAIDTIDSNMIIGVPNAQMRVPIGGFAHAGVRGISKVELRVDDRPWQQAELRTPLSRQTWVIWRYDWPREKGKHTFTVRCFEADGEPQIAQDAPPDPSGATGLNTRTAMF